MNTAATQVATPGGPEPVPEVFTEGDALYADMLEGMERAQRRIWLETYIFADDEIGRRFVEVLGRRAREGLDVRVQIDAAGSLFWRGNRVAAALREQGVSLQWFHRWSWRHALRYNRRNHRKLLVIDSDRAYLGGFNIHRENSLQLHGEKRWRDTHARIGEQTAVEQAAELFLGFWRKPYRDSPGLYDSPLGSLVSSHNRHLRRHLRLRLGLMLRRARREVCVTTPYFIPYIGLVRALSAAAAQGADVRVLVPGRLNNHPVARWAAQAVYAPLLAQGVRIFEYQPRMLHAKTLLCDGEVCALGTANMDYRSFFLNCELMLFTDNATLCRRLAEDFARDQEQAEEIHLHTWSRRPWLNRVLERYGWMLRRLL